MYFPKINHSHTHKKYYNVTAKIKINEELF